MAMRRHDAATITNCSSSLGPPLQVACVNSEHAERQQQQSDALMFAIK
jgi:hypothetical protein